MFLRQNSMFVDPQILFELHWYFCYADIKLVKSIWIKNDL